jgi:beta-lactamase regulating signal transducer with metallopeptidase domain
MNVLLHWLTTPEWAVVVKTLLHSLWQGALVAAGLALLLGRLQRPTVRYALALGALWGVVAAMLVTWGILSAPAAEQPRVVPVVLPEAKTPQPTTQATDTIVVVASWTRAAPTVDWTAWLALVWLLGASVMLGRASVKVAGAERLRRSCQPLNDPRITDLVNEARRAVKLARQVRLAVTNQLTSPAVVGVLVPTLVLPLSLITSLSHEQIRFILLHELAHIRRGDYLANLFQLFAEALLFFNPAVWWISHQVRREREACCDALAIETSGAPADYARTLVSVAEGLLHPSASAAAAFGESNEPSALSDRVQRALVPGYRPSLRLTWRAMLAALALGGLVLSLLAIGARDTVAATAALMVSERSAEAATNALANPSGSTNSSEGIMNAARLVQDAKLAFELGRMDQAEKLLRSALSLDPENGAANFYLGLVQSRSNDSKQIDRIASPKQILTKLNSIRLERVFFDAVPLGEVILVLSEESKRLDPAARGLVFVMSSPDPEPTSAIPVSIQPALTNVSLAVLLDAIVKGAESPIRYAIAETMIVFSPNTSTGPPPLLTRTYILDSHQLAQALKQNLPDASTNTALALREFFASLGVDFTPPRAMFYKETTGGLFVRATKEDLEVIDEALAMLNRQPAQVNIRAKFVEMPFDRAASVLEDLLLTNQSPGRFTGIVTEPQAKRLFKTLETMDGVDILSAPEVTTLSGRQAQVQVVDIMTLVTGVTSIVTNGAGTNVLNTTTMPVGPVLDIIPSVADDGYTVHLTIIPTVTEFIGYDKPDPLLTEAAAKRGIDTPLPLPRFRNRQLTASVSVWDGQTVVLGGFISETVTRQPDGTETRESTPELDKKQLLVFVTPTVIDQAGNRRNGEPAK